MTCFNGGMSSLLLGSASGGCLTIRFSANFSHPGIGFEMNWVYSIFGSSTSLKRKSKNQESLSKTKEEVMYVI